MKKVLFSLTVASVMGFSTVNATAIKAFDGGTAVQQDGKTAVKPEELPDAVQKTLAGDDYKGWTVSVAYALKANDGSAYYQVDLKNGEQAKTVKLTADGKLID